MYRPMELFTRIFALFIFVGACILLTMQFNRGQAQAFGLKIPELPWTKPALKTDRPAELGNAAAEAFLRNRKHPAVIPAYGVIVLNDGDFSEICSELYDHRDKYYGREIEFSGLVKEKTTLGKGDFFIGRQLLWNIGIDTYFIGFLAFSDGIPPVPGSTVRIHGVLSPTGYKDLETGKSYVIPAIRASSIEIVFFEAPTVYPAKDTPR